MVYFGQKRGPPFRWRTPCDSNYKICLKVTFVALKPANRRSPKCRFGYMPVDIAGDLMSRAVTNVFFVQRLLPQLGLKSRLPLE